MADEVARADDVVGRGVDPGRPGVRVPDGDAGRAQGGKQGPRLVDLDRQHAGRRVASVEVLAADGHADQPARPVLLDGGFEGGEFGGVVGCVFGLKGGKEGGGKVSWVVSGRGGRGAEGKSTQTPARSLVFVARAAGMALARVLQSELANRRALEK